MNDHQPMDDHRSGSGEEIEDGSIEVSALAINVAVPEALQWTDTRRGQEFRLTSITVRLLPDSSLAAKAYERPVEGGRGATCPSPCPRHRRSARSSRPVPVRRPCDGRVRGDWAEAGARSPRSVRALEHGERFGHLAPQRGIEGKQRTREHRTLHQPELSGDLRDHANASAAAGEEIPESLQTVR